MEAKVDIGVQFTSWEDSSLPTAFEGAKPKKPNEVPQPIPTPETSPSKEPVPVVWPQKEPEIQPGEEPLTIPPTAPPEVPLRPQMLSMDSVFNVRGLTLTQFFFYRVRYFSAFAYTRMLKMPFNSLCHGCVLGHRMSRVPFLV